MKVDADNANPECCMATVEANGETLIDRCVIDRSGASHPVTKLQCPSRGRTQRMNRLSLISGF